MSFSGSFSSLKTVAQPVIGALGIALGALYDSAFQAFDVWMPRISIFLGVGLCLLTIYKTYLDVQERRRRMTKKVK